MLFVKLYKEEIKRDTNLEEKLVRTTYS